MVDRSDLHPVGEAEPVEDDAWASLRQATRARIGLGRAGHSLPTRRELELRSAHAAARDAIHEPLDLAALADQVEPLGLGAPVVVASRCRSRAEYLRRPDLGRLPADLAQVDTTSRQDGDDPDVVVVLADGLSPRALADHGVGLLAAVVDALSGWRFAAPVIATQARVALGDHVGAAVRARNVVTIIGERPGLSVADSLGIYLTHRPRPGLTDADRNCISNIHPPDGLGYVAAARTLANLVECAHRIGRSGVELSREVGQREGNELAE